MASLVVAASRAEAARKAEEERSMSESFRPILTGKKALVVGIANDQSIAYGCAKMFREAGAELAVTWLNEKARRFVEPLAAGAGRLDHRRPGCHRARTDGGDVRRDRPALGPA